MATPGSPGVEDGGAVGGFRLGGGYLAGPGDAEGGRSPSPEGPVDVARSDGEGWCEMSEGCSQGLFQLPLAAIRTAPHQ
jgi:hypothetical protein